MNQSLCILGRQPALGLAELESLYGANAIRPVGEAAALALLPPEQLEFARLGGSVKLGRVIEQLHSANWSQFEKYAYKLAKNLAHELPEGKIQLGLSVYDFDGVSPQKITAIGLTLKKQLKKAGRSVRLVPNNEPALSSAQVFHNHLAGEHGCELLIVHDGHDIFIAQTTDVQDIDSYTLRDRGRPKRDSKVGMLPPKLAQIIINLAVGELKGQNTTILDPFCGTGVLLQEAYLMGHGIYGTDIEPRMIDYTDANLQWIQSIHSRRVEGATEVGDATQHVWQKTPFNAVACEGYLGQPFSAFPTEAKLRDVMQTCNTIMKGFLKNIHGQIQPGTRLCVALPAWQRKPGEFLCLPLLDSLEEIGYNRIGFEHASDNDLIYARADQIVARQLVVLTRK